MSTQDIIQNLISQLGQSQADRLAEELRPHFADVDERTPEDLLLFVKALSEHVRYYRGSDGSPDGDWRAFFPDQSGAAQLVAGASGNLPPHLALLAAFLCLHELPRVAINGITASHLDFYYRRVLGFEAQPAIRDRAHVVFELKKNVAPERVLPEHKLSAGKDAKGVELIYQPVREAVVGISKIEELRSIFVDPSGRGTIRCAPIANSSDGVGGRLPEQAPAWHPFGHSGLAPGTIGFALSSPVLRMQEGTRKVTLSLTLGNLSASVLGAAALAGALEVFVTGKQSWLGPYTLSTAIAGDLLQLRFEVPKTDPAVLDYDTRIHGPAYAADSPVAQVLLKSGGAVGYRDLAGLILRKVQIAVDVEGITSLALENDSGTLDPKKAFLPFGAQPVKGSRFMIGCMEALSKSLSKIELNVLWQDRPDSFATRYANYGRDVNDGTFTASVVFQEAGHALQRYARQKLFEGTTDDKGERVLSFEPGGTAPVPGGLLQANLFHALDSAGTAAAARSAAGLAQLRPLLRFARSPAPAARSGFITMSLDLDFLHDVYRQKSVENLLRYGKGETRTLTMLAEPYTPAIQAISLGYKAQTSEVDLESASGESFANPDIRFFHVGCFGQRREHAYLRGQLDHVADKRVSLLPAHEDQGELMLGLSNLWAGDSVSVLFQVSDGSGDPDIDWPEVRWAVLCDNHWKQLGSAERVLDTTNGLRSSGLVGVVVPPEATTDNTFLPAGRLWLRAAVARSASQVSQLLAVAANAVEVRFHENGNDPNHLAAALPARTIAKLKTPIPGVKSVAQPYASFGGRLIETPESLQTRAAERLRHKDRCITPWDYERIVLKAFPQIYKVKCIPHAKPGAWQAPGNVLVVVIPDLRNTSGRDPLQPRVAADTLADVEAYLKQRAGMQVVVKVRNPVYQKVRLDFKVKFQAGYEFNAYRTLLERELIEFLSPWAYGAERSISFGGRIYRSVLLDFVEERGYVDYVTDFKLYSYTFTLDGVQDLAEVSPQTPDAILVSDANHAVGQAP
jgi:hypothetical protein